MDEMYQRTQSRLPEPRATAASVARYLVEKTNGMGMAQLNVQKLLYYCQAASLAWTKRRMFGERIEAWINGPVVVPFWENHRYEGWIKSVPEGAALEDPLARQIADKVFDRYGHLAPGELVELTHREPPWRNARTAYAPNERGKKEIKAADMLSYYVQNW